METLARYLDRKRAKREGGRDGIKPHKPGVLSRTSSTAIPMIVAVFSSASPRRHGATSALFMERFAPHIGKVPGAVPAAVVVRNSSPRRPMHRLHGGV